MFIIRDVIKDTQTGEVSIFYVAKNRVYITPYILYGFQRQADCEKSLRYEMQDNEIISDFKAIESKRWEHTYSIVDKEQECEMWSKREDARNHLNKKVRGLMTSLYLSNNEDERKDLQRDIDEWVSAFCNDTTWKVVCLPFDQIMTEIKRDWEHDRFELINERLNQSIYHITQEIRAVAKLNPIEERELRRRFTKDGFELECVERDANGIHWVYTFTKFTDRK